MRTRLPLNVTCPVSVTGRATAPATGVSARTFDLQRTAVVHNFVLYKAAVLAAQEYATKLLSHLL